MSGWLSSVTGSARYRRALVLLCLLGALVLAPVALRVAEAGPAAAGTGNEARPSPAVAVVRTGHDTSADTVFAYVGANFNQVLTFDPRAQSYTLDFYLWMRWRGDVDLTQTTELVNVLGSEYTMAPSYPKAQEIGGGEKYQNWHVQADFVAPLDFTDYPRDRQTLVVKVEDSQLDSANLVYLPEQVTASAEFAEIPAGYVLGSAPDDAQVIDHVYPTNFGLPGAAASKYSQVVFSFSVVRPIRSYLGKSFLPIAIVVIIALMSYVLGPARVDSRVALSVTALISAVLLHMDAVGQIPPTSHFLRVDLIFLTSYAVILLALIESIVSVHAHDSGRQQLARRLDIAAAVVSVLIFWAGVTGALA